MKKEKSKTTQCKVCGAEIAKNAKTCPNCGAKNKKPIYKRVWFWLLIVIVVLVIIVIIVACAGGSSENPATKEAKEMSKTDFINSCESYNYKDLERNADELSGSYIKVTLWIEQDVDGGTTYRAYSKGPYDDSTMWSGNEYLLNDVRDNPDPKIVEQDIVTVYGVYNGEQTVERAIGGEDNVPSIDILYADIQNAN